MQLLCLALGIIGSVASIELGDVFAKKVSHALDVGKIKRYLTAIIYTLGISLVVVFLWELKQSYILYQLGVYIFCFTISKYMPHNPPKSDL